MATTTHKTSSKYGIRTFTTHSPGRKRRYLPPPTHRFNKLSTDYAQHRNKRDVNNCKTKVGAGCLSDIQHRSRLTVIGYICQHFENIPVDILNLVLLFYAKPLLMNIQYKYAYGKHTEIKSILCHPIYETWDSLCNKIKAAFLFYEDDHNRVSIVGLFYVNDRVTIGKRQWDWYLWNNEDTFRLVLDVSFDAMADVFSLVDRMWRSRGLGLVRFDMDNKSRMHLSIRVGTSYEVKRRLLQPQIHSKGHGAFVFRTAAVQGLDAEVFAVRFYSEDNIRSFRVFVTNGGNSKRI